ncbi:MAG: DeoR/GlpR transcriptional regulator [Anaerolineales bacterium]|nr:MAG: DeoR/GlpR transcriptional regulator [Anaerolineales bacterium]
MFLEERRQEILKFVVQQGRASVTELSERFNVSDVTIRADLQALADSALIVRTYGGAIPPVNSIYELSLNRRRQQQQVEKQRIGEVASHLIADGEAIFLDSSSTALTITPYIKQLRDLTVVTNSLVIAQEMLSAPNIAVVMPGGTLHPDTVSLSDPLGLELLKRYNIAWGFFGAYGLSLSVGLTDVTATEAVVKRPLVAMCRQVVVVLDGTKWGREGVASYAALSDVNVIITDVGAPPDMVEAVQALGILVSVV